MPAPNPVITVVREWLVKAENDLLTAAHTLTLGADCPTDAVCFHAQQCVEKYIKALLVFRATPFSKTHNIRVLRALQRNPRKWESGEDGQLPIFTNLPFSGIALQSPCCGRSCHRNFALNWTARFRIG